MVDVPYVGKRLVSEYENYDRTLGISWWKKNYITPIEDNSGLNRQYPFYDPIYTLPPEGGEIWKKSLGFNPQRMS